MKLRNENIFFTSDTHFDHKNIIALCDRPFTSVEDMNYTMIEKWNDVVGYGDTVFHLGDMFWRSHVEHNMGLFNQLNGLIHFVRGNHDEGAYRLREMFSSFQDYLELKVDNKHRFVLCHYPLLTWNSIHAGVIQLHGHVHGTLDNARDRNWRTRIDVGVDSWNFEPVHLEQILLEIEAREREYARTTD